MTAPQSRSNTPASEPHTAVQVIFAPEKSPLSPWQRWTTFWFRKSDPTTLAFIRICTGLIVFYIHLSYSLDLQAIFGKHGWYALTFIDKERHEGPAYIPPVNSSWDEVFMVPQLSDFPHRREAFMKFLRGLPEEKSKREMALKYLNRLNGLKNADEFRLGMVYIQMMITEQDVENYLRVLEGKKVTTDDGKTDLTTQFINNTPAFINALPQEDKLLLEVEIRAFWDILARTLDADGRTYVFSFFYEVNPDMRRAIVSYLNSIPDDPKERKKLLDYMEYWNSDYRKAHQLGYGIFSFWFHVTDPTQMGLFHTGVLVLLALFTIGLFTRVTSVLVWIATVSYIHRTQQVLFGMDTMMNILLFYLMIGNSGAALSVDRLIARYRAARASLARSGTLDANTKAFLGCPPPSANAGFALRLIQVHFCFIYMAAGLSKLKGANWWEGRAIWDVVANPEFTLMPYAFYEWSLRMLATYKPIYYSWIIFGAWSTLFIEITGTFFFWSRLRWFMILIASLMHTMIAILMGLNLFQMLMMVMLLSYFPDRVVRDRFRGAGNLLRMAFTFNPTNPGHARAAALIAATDVDNQVALVPDKTALATHIASHDETPAGGQAGIGFLFRHSRLLSKLGLALWIPGMKSLLAKKLALAPDSPAGAPAVKPPAASVSR